MKNVTSFLFFLSLFISMTSCQSQPRETLAQDKQQFWYPCAEGSMGGTNFVVYLKNEDDYKQMLLYVGCDLTPLKDTILKLTSKKIKIYYIQGSWCKVSIINKNYGTENLVALVDELLQKQGLSKGYMTVEEEEQNHQLNQDLNTIKLNK